MKDKDMKTLNKLQERIAELVYFIPSPTGKLAMPCDRHWGDDFGVSCTCDPTKRDYDLEDVLMAYSKSLTDDKFIKLYEDNGGYEIHTGVIELLVKWNLGKPLSEQSEETLNFLWEILK